MDDSSSDSIGHNSAPGVHDVTLTARTPEHRGAPIAAAVPSTAAGERADGVYTDTPATDNQAIEVKLNALLGTPTPDDWRDPVMLASRTAKLQRAACDAGETMIELLVRLRDERARDVHLREGGCVYGCVDVMFNLHRALASYQHATLRHDGEDIARDAITRTHGVGVTALTMRALAELRVLIVNEMQSLSR
jgi:hypothetical protein